MSFKEIVAFGFLLGLLVLMTWTKPEEIDKDGNRCAYFRGLRFASPVILVFYALMMFDTMQASTSADCGNTTAETVILGIILTLLFVAPLPYYITRKLTLIGDRLTGFSIFSGTKSMKLEDIESISNSYMWGGFIIKTPQTKIVMEKMLSGREQLLAAIERARADEN